MRLETMFSQEGHQLVLSQSCVVIVTAKFSHRNTGVHDEDGNDQRTQCSPGLVRFVIYLAVHKLLH